MTEDELRVWLARYLMEFGSGPVTLETFWDNEWYHEQNIRVEDFAPGRNYAKWGIEFKYKENPRSYKAHTYTMPQEALDFLKGEAK